MSFTRRQFLQQSLHAGVGFTAISYLGSYMCLPLRADGVDSVNDEEMAFWSCSHCNPYVSTISKTGSDTTTWLQIDMGSTQSIDTVKLYPALAILSPPGEFYAKATNFPLRFKIEASDDPDFQTAALITDQTAADFPDPHRKIIQFSTTAKGRYLRLTATKLTGDKLSVAKMDVLFNGTNLAEKAPAQADSTLGNGSARQVTRKTRPMGETLVTDNPGNVIPADRWNPVAYAALSPLTGVTLGDGLFQTAMETNIRYLLKETADDLLQSFRTRAGKANPPGLRPLQAFWDGDLPGSGAGRFLMGAGNTLRWMEHPQLREQMNAIIAGIAECAAPDDGYLMAYPKETIFFSERGAYTRSWVTQGIIEAGYAGNEKAFPLLRPYYDWYNQCEYRPKLLRGCGMGPQGMVANTRLYFTPVGKPDDIHVVQRYLQENYFLDGLAERDPEMIWQYPYDRPHSYIITFLEAYLDIYRATGEQHYLDAMHGAWDLFHDHWEHLGGTISLTEFEQHPPDSYRLLAGTGEFCGNVFWTRFNSRFHQLYPEQEKYVNEIEKSIYNVALANQLDDSGLIYHAKLTGHKENPTHVNTCCEGQGSRMIGSLPEYIYSIAPDGVFVNLFEPSTLAWTVGEHSLALQMVTKFPFKNDVTLTVTASQPTNLKLRVRIPAWAAREMVVRVNGAPAISGSPGTYVTLDNNWKTGDTIDFTLPAEFKLTRYTGVDQVPDHAAYGLEYGPILFAMISEQSSTLKANGPTADSLLKQLVPKPDAPLHFTIDGNDGYEFMPYWQVKKQRFTCFPIIDAA